MASDLENARRESIASSGAGFPFLTAYGTTWIAAGALSHLVPVTTAAWIYLLQAVVAMPLALGLQALLRYPKAAPGNPLWPLAIQLVLIQAVAFPVYVLMLEVAPVLVPAVFAALVGAHFLPFQWLYRTPIYGVLGFTIALGSYVIAVAADAAAVHWTGYFVGASLLVAAVALRAHARRELAAG